MSDLYTKIIANYIFPLHEKLKGHSTTSILRRLDTSQWWPPEEINQDVNQRLQRFISDVLINVPFYRRLFSEYGYGVSDICTMDDLEKLPLLDKATIRHHYADFMSEKAGRMVKLNTGGSSGNPLVFQVGMKRISHDVAAKWRATRWWGVDIGDKELVVWGSPVEIGSQDRLKTLRDNLFRSQLLPAFDITEKSLKVYLEKIKSFKPKMLFGYPSVLSFIAKYAERNDMDLSGLGIKVCFVTSEKLYPEQRQVIERVFSCRVANGYGGRDSGFIAHECEYGSMHMSAEDIMVEIVDKDGKQNKPGEFGEIVVTHLDTNEFPFVRYRTGDMGMIGENSCPCGRGLPVLSEIQGRTTDFIVGSDGTIMHGLSLIYVMRTQPTIAEFKIIQESLETIRIVMVADAGYDIDSSERFITEEFRKRLGNEVRVLFEYANVMPSEKSGKYRYVISKVAENFLNA